MSEIENVKSVVRKTGSGGIDFPNGLKISGSNFVPGATRYSQAEEPSSPTNGDTWWDTDDEKYKMYINDSWMVLYGDEDLRYWFGSRGVWAGGGKDDMNYITIQTTGNSTSFGNLTSISYTGSGTSDGVRGVIHLGSTDNSSPSVKIDYITVATTGNAANFGDMGTGALMYTSSVCDGNIAVIGNGYNGSGNAADLNYITVQTTGNATDFGDLTTGRRIGAAVNDATYGVWAGGYTSSWSNIMDYITIATPGNGTDFGDLTAGHSMFQSAVGDRTRGVFGGGSYMDYITIATPANATNSGYNGGSRPSNDRARGVSDASRGVFGNAYPGYQDSSMIYITIQSLSNAVTFGTDSPHQWFYAGLSGT